MGSFCTSLPELEKLLLTRWTESGAQQESVEDGWLSGAIERAQWSLGQSLSTVCTFLATKVVYWDHRQDWLESLYRHSVDRCRIDTALEDLNKDLGEACSKTLEGARNKMAGVALSFCKSINIPICNLGLCLATMGCVEPSLGHEAKISCTRSWCM